MVIVVSVDLVSRLKKLWLRVGIIEAVIITIILLLQFDKILIQTFLLL